MRFICGATALLLLLVNSAWGYSTHLCFSLHDAKLDTDTFDLSIKEADFADNLSMDNAEGVLTQIKVVETDTVGDYLVRHIYFGDDTPFISRGGDVFTNENGAVLYMGAKVDGNVKVVLTETGSRVRIKTFLCRTIDY